MQLKYDSSVGEVTTLHELIVSEPFAHMIKVGSHVLVDDELYTVVSIDGPRLGIKSPNWFRHFVYNPRQALRRLRRKYGKK